MRYNANDYFFVQDKDLLNIVHPRPDQEGKDGSRRFRPIAMVKMAFLVDGPRT
jgi:hypothetical protein